MLQCMGFFPSISACLWNSSGELLSGGCCRHVLQLSRVTRVAPRSNRVWFHRNCWTNSFRKRCTVSFLSQKMQALATRRKAWRPSSTGAVLVLSVKSQCGHTWVRLGLGRLTSRGISKTLPIFGNMAFTHLQKLQAEQDPIATSESRLILVLLGKRA